MGWFFVMGFYFVVMMLLKSRVPGSRKLQKMPIRIMTFAALFWIGYSMRLYNCDLTVTDILIIVLLLESAIQSGLLPSNTNYQQLFVAGGDFSAQCRRYDPDLCCYRGTEAEEYRIGSLESKTAQIRRKCR